MKTVLKNVVLVLTALALLVSLASCDKSGSIKKAYEKANYAVASYTGDSEDAKKFASIAGLSDEEKEELADYEIIVVNKKADDSKTGLDGIIADLGTLIPDAIIIKFPSAGDLKDYLITEDDEGNKDTAAYDKAKEDGKINGNCLFVFGDDAAKEVFAK